MHWPGSSKDRYNSAPSSWLWPQIRRWEAAQGSPPWVPIVALTASALPEDRSLCLEAGMDDHLAKPVRLQQLTNVVERWLFRKQPAEAPQPDPSADAAVIDELRALAGDDPSFLSDLVATYLHAATDQIRKMQEAAASGDQATLSATAHVLRGGSAGLGATEVAGACRLVEYPPVPPSGEEQTAAVERVRVALQRVTPLRLAL